MSGQTGDHGAVISLTSTEEEQGSPSISMRNGDLGTSLKEEWARPVVRMSGVSRRSCNLLTSLKEEW